MSKHKRLKAARRKQHNATAKDRAREWAERCVIMRQEGEAARARRIALLAEDAKITEALPPVDPLSKLIDGMLVGGQLLGNLYHPDGTLDLLRIATRVQSLGGVSFIDTEGSVFGKTVTIHEKGMVCVKGWESTVQIPRRHFKIGDPKAEHTEQCMARHMVRYTEAGRIEAELIAKGEEALAVYLHPTFMECTCDQIEEQENNGGWKLGSDETQA